MVISFRDDSGGRRGLGVEGKEWEGVYQGDAERWSNCDPGIWFKYSQKVYDLNVIISMLLMNMIRKLQTF